MTEFYRKNKLEAAKLLKAEAYVNRFQRLSWAREVLDVYHFVSWRHFVRRFGIAERAARADLKAFIDVSADVAFSDVLGCAVLRVTPPVTNKITKESLPS